MLLPLTRTLVFLCLLLFSFNSYSAVNADSSCHNVKPTHEAFEVLLSRYVRAGQVDYMTWQKNKTDRQALHGYVRHLAEYCPDDFKSLDKPGQLALLLNLYNAAVIERVLQYFPVESITDIRIDSKDAFNVAWIPVSWSTIREMSLNHLENELIRPMFKDTRIHFALVCAAKSCPELLARPYRAETVLNQLRHQTRSFFQNEEQVSYRQDENALVVSKIFKWYEKDFVADAGSLQAYLVREFKRANGVDIPADVKVLFHDYSWVLNQSP